MSRFQRTGMRLNTGAESGSYGAGGFFGQAGRLLAQMSISSPTKRGCACLEFEGRPAGLSVWEVWERRLIGLRSFRWQRWMTKAEVHRDESGRPVIPNMSLFVKRLRPLAAASFCSVFTFDRLASCQPLACSSGTTRSGSDVDVFFRRRCEI